MPMGCPSFPSRDGGVFLREVRDEVEQYFRDRGRRSFGDARMISKTLCMLALTFVPYLLIMTGGFSGPVSLGLAVLVGFGVAGIGFSVAHDALHGSYSDNPRLNQILGWTMDLAGGSSYLWKITHNIIHHTYTNVHGADEDLSVSPLLRLSPHAERRWFHRLQHWYALLLYSMTTLFWAFVKDYRYLLQQDLGPYQDRRHRTRDVVGLMIGKMVFYCWSLVLPIVLLPFPWWGTALGILLAHLVAGTTLGIVFQLAHVVEQTSHPEPDAEGGMPDGWAAHEMLTTANFAPGNRFLTWYTGGLNYQVEHHLFPKVCSIHYPRISGIVERVAREHGLPYHYNATFWGAVRSHLRTLRQHGLPDAVPASAGQGAD